MRPTDVATGADDLPRAGEAATVPAHGWSGGAAHAYDVSFGRLCAGAADELLDRLEAVPGTTLLDVGSGTGRLSVRAAERGLVVTAVEPDPAMRAVAAGRLARAGVAQLSGRAPTLPLASGSVDHVVASFVVNHVPDPRATVADLVRVTAVGGRVACAIWGSPPPLGELWADVVAVDGVVPPPTTRLPPDRDFRRDPAGVAALLRGAGLEVVDAGVVRWTFRVAPEDLWQGPAHGLAGIGALVAAQPAEIRPALHEAFRATAASRARDGVLHEEVQAVVAVGRKS